MQQYANLSIWLAVSLILASLTYYCLASYPGDKSIHQKHSTSTTPLNPQQSQDVDCQKQIAVIIPTLRDAAVLAATVERLFMNASNGPMNRTNVALTISVIIVDASQDSECQRCLGHLMSAYSTLHIVPYPGKPSRGSQLNFGAAHAAKLVPEASILVFLHADTHMPPSWDGSIIDALSSTVQAPVLGCFKLSLPPPLTVSLRIMLWGANIRARRLPYGDQCFFMTKPAFKELEGFPAVPIMEDLEMVRRVSQRGGSIKVLEQAVQTDPRRWKRKGVFWNTVLNQLFIMAWLCGVSHETIYKWYYGKSSTKRKN